MLEQIRLLASAGSSKAGDMGHKLKRLNDQIPASSSSSSSSSKPITIQPLMDRAIGHKAPSGDMAVNTALTCAGPSLLLYLFPLWMLAQFIRRSSKKL